MQQHSALVYHMVTISRPDRRSTEVLCTRHAFPMAVSHPSFTSCAVSQFCRGHPDLGRMFLSFVPVSASPGITQLYRSVFCEPFHKQQASKKLAFSAHPSLPLALCPVQSSYKGWDLVSGAGRACCPRRSNRSYIIGITAPKRQGELP